MRIRKEAVVVLVLLVVFAAVPSVAFAAGASGGGKLISGLNNTATFFIDVFGYVGMLAFMGGGAALLFGELNDTFKFSAKAVFGTGVVLCAPPVFKFFFTLSGAMAVALPPDETLATPPAAVVATRD